MSSAVSKVDSKGRISIPIGFRVKLKLIEGSRVKIVLKKDRLILVPDGQSSVKVSIDSKSAKDCGSSRAGSSPASDPEKLLL